MMTLDPAAFNNVSILELDISYNRLQSLDPSVFFPLNRSLSRLKISGNPLQVSNLWSSVLSPRANLNLSDLDVADIPIGRDQFFQSDLFAFHKGLKNLNLSGSGLTYLPVELVQSLPSLRSLDLSRNELSSLTDLTLSALSVLQNFRYIQLHDNPWYCDACVIGPMLKWLDVSPASRHIKDGCRGLKTNAANLSTDYNTDDGAQLCPACRYPPAVAGVELPRLDHVNLPNCNSPPSLIDSRGSPSKVRAAATATGGPSTDISGLTLTTRFMQFVENPLYLALICGLGILVIAAFGAALAIVSRHAASYYTNEGRRNKAAAADLGTVTADESEGLFPLKLVSDSETQRSQIVKIGRKQLQLKLDEGEKRQLNKNNNGKAIRKDESPVRAHNSGANTISVTSRGVHCPGNTTVYPMIVEQERSLC